MSKYKLGNKVVLTVTGTDEMGHYPNYVLNDNFYLWEQSIDNYAEPLSTYTEPLEAKIRRQATEITRLLTENKRLKETKTEDIEHWCDVCTKQSVIEQARSDGAEAAWELAGKIALLENGYSNNKLKEIFGSIYLNDIFNLTYIAAAAKVTEWEKAKEEIKVGDVVSHEEKYGVVISEGTICFRGFTDDGTPFEWYKERCKKTGRHIDIDSFLKQIGEE